MGCGGCAWRVESVAGAAAGSRRSAGKPRHPSAPGEGAGAVWRSIHHPRDDLQRPPGPQAFRPALAHGCRCAGSDRGRCGDRARRAPAGGGSRARRPHRAPAGQPRRFGAGDRTRSRSGGRPAPALWRRSPLSATGGRRPGPAPAAAGGARSREGGGQHSLQHHRSPAGAAGGPAGSAP